MKPGREAPGTVAPLRTTLVILASTACAALSAAAADDGRDLPAIPEPPGAPPNAAARVVRDGGAFRLVYGNRTILESAGPVAVLDTETVRSRMAADMEDPAVLTQTVPLAAARGTRPALHVHGSTEAIAAETRGPAQERFPMVRTSRGPSRNLRNNAVYDRRSDWVLEFPQGTVIVPERRDDGIRFSVTLPEGGGDVVFRPRFYQKHRNLPYFTPWTYTVRTDPITGWCSWWVYRRGISLEKVRGVMDVWNRQRMDDFGYRFIQLDDGYQGERDRGRRKPERIQTKKYIGGRPETWLHWLEKPFPTGMRGFADAVVAAGYEPAVWVGCFFTDLDTVRDHPDWFARADADGEPMIGKVVTYVMDATNPEVVENLIRPTFRGFAEAGFRYVKIDQLRHMLYDNLAHCTEWMAEKGIRPDDLFRAYLRVAREELGPDCFILSCWGVLPEAIGIVDACRIGGDGYGPVGLQQYNSWNGIVWVNDPDHCDVSPRKRGGNAGNVTRFEDAEAAANDPVIRPALASIAGAMLMLSDAPEVYADEANLRGAKRSAPVLASVPGQLYDFDPSKTDKANRIDRAYLGNAGRLDADREGYVCPFWLNEFNPGFDHWVVLHRLNWSDDDPRTAAPVEIRFADLGLDPGATYLVHEFWSDRSLGVFRDSFPLGELEPMGIESLAIRRVLDRPQLVSTNRHLSHGAAEIEAMEWDDGALSGRSALVASDRYVLTLHLPDGYGVSGAVFDGRPADVEVRGSVARIGFLPDATGPVDWAVTFDRD